MRRINTKLKKIFNRCTALIVAALIVFGAIIVKLINLQVIETNSYKAKANSTAHRFIKEAAPRGEISDSTGTLLATNKQSYDVTYIQTDDNKSNFYNNVAKVFYILDQNGDKQNDSFALKYYPACGYSFDFNTTNQSEIKKMQLRFLKDRGFEEDIIKKLYKGKTKEAELNHDQVAEVNSELLKISPKKAFNDLVKSYKIPSSYKIIVDGNTISKNCDVNDIRRFMVVKDAVKMQSYSGYKPITIASNVKKDTAFTILQKSNGLSGIDISVDPIRNYPYGNLASNVLGYISKITPSTTDESKKYKEEGYDVNTDLIGTSGIEAALEDRLKGTSGGKIVEVNKQGKIIDELAKKDPYPGQNVQLTINKDVQYAAEQALIKTMAQLRGKGSVTSQGGNISYLGNATRGAAVAIDVKTGGVLALASVPNFNPNDFADPNGLSQATLSKYFSTDIISTAKSVGVPANLYDTLFPQSTSNSKVRIDKYDYLPKPLYDYATMSLIPPGSTFKPLTAIAGLETGTITPSFSVYDPGYFIDGSYKPIFKSDGDLGTNDLVNALAKSSNAYFMTVAQRLRMRYGVDILAKYAWDFGLGVPNNSNVNPSTGIEIKENFGQVYNSHTAKNSFGQQGTWTIMESLQNGTYLKGTSISLYTNSRDSNELSDLKSAIKSNIKGSISAGKFDRNKTEELITKLISIDPLYKGKTFSKSDIKAVTSGMIHDESDQYAQAVTPSNIYSAAIGQGLNQFTPLQLANYVATIANGGKRYKVHLVDKVKDSNGKIVYENKPEVVKDTGVKASTIAAIKQGMNAVNDRGTAAETFANFNIAAAGKTGTADPYSEEEEQKIMRTSYAVYVGFAPSDNPRIAVATVVFDGGFGTGIANIAKSMYEAYFKDELKARNFKFDADVDAKPEADTSSVPVAASSHESQN